MEILIQNAMILSMDQEQEIIQNGYVFIKDRSITEVKEGTFEGNLEGVTIIDGTGHVVMPGLINGHTHAAMTILRGYGEGLPLMKWLHEKIWPMEGKFKEAHIQIGTQLACIEMLRSGTTTFNDMYFMQQEVWKASETFPMRAVLGLPIIGENWEAQLKEALNLSERIQGEWGDKTVSTMLAPHSPYTLSDEALREIAQVAAQHHSSIHIHLAETLDEVNIIREKYHKTPCEFLLDTGILENKVAAAHCVHLTEEDMEIMKEKKVSAIYNPQSNMKLASGVAKVAELLDRNINVALGTDGASSNNNLNMFEEMETGALLQKLWYKDATKLDSKTVIHMATIHGAKALGLNKVGKIKEGYKADLIMLNLNQAHMMPLHDIYSNLVFSANGSEVQTVIVNGQLVMHKGSFLHIDEERIKFNFNKIIKELLNI